MKWSSFFPLVLVFSVSMFSVNGNTNLILQICKSTKYYDLCVSSLKSNSISFKADPKGLALIMVRLGMANATATNFYLSSEVLSSTNDTKMKKAVKECASKYSYANEALKYSEQDLGEELYDYAYMHVMAASDYSNACHNGFTSKSKSSPRLAYPPQLASREAGFKKICDVVLGIIDTLV